MPSGLYGSREHAPAVVGRGAICPACLRITVDILGAHHAGMHPLAPRPRLVAGWWREAGGWRARGLSTM